MKQSLYIYMYVTLLMLFRVFVDMYMYHYTNLTVVRESVCDREVNGSNLNHAKKFSFSASLDLDVTTGSPLTTQRRH